MGLNVTSVNTPFERACKNCGVNTRKHFRIGETVNVFGACNYCIGSVLCEKTENGFSRGTAMANRSGRVNEENNQWHDGVEPFNREKLVKLFDDEFIQNGGGIRSDANILQQPYGVSEDVDSRTYYDELLNELCEDGVLQETQIGVDEMLGYEISFERQGELIVQLDLEVKWDNTDNNISRNRIDTILQNVAENTDYDMEELLTKK